MIVLMVLVLVFAKASAASGGAVRILVLVLMWFCVLLSMFSLSCLATSVFFKWPMDLQYWLAKDEGRSGPSPRPAPRPEEPPHKPAPNLHSFAFDTVVVNQKGVATKHVKGEARSFEEDLGHEINLEMVEVPESKFLMGSPDNEPERLSNEGPQRSVDISKFFIGKFEVTQEQWRIVSGLPQVKVQLEPDPSNFPGNKRPVERVSWSEALEFTAEVQS
jgi:formylglycine-generating enzyme required for sulfatase activity